MRITFGGADNRPSPPVGDLPAERLRIVGEVDGGGPTNESDAGRQMSLEGRNGRTTHTHLLGGAS